MHAVDPIFSDRQAPSGNRQDTNQPIMYIYRPYRCQVCRTEKEILTDNDGPCMDFCDGCSSNPDQQPDMAQTVSAFGSTRTLRPFECIEEWIQSDVELHEDVMQRSPLFAEMSSWQVKRVIMLGEIRRFEADDTIVAQGQTDKFTYVLLTGSARVMITNTSGDDVRAATIGIGEVFGEVASILGMSRTASVIAETSSRVFVLDAPAVERVGRYYPRIAFHISRNSARVLGRRFQGVNAELAEWKHITDDAD
jgi:hypothetical protein